MNLEEVMQEKPVKVPSDLQVGQYQVIPGTGIQIQYAVDGFSGALIITFDQDPGLESAMNAFQTIVEEAVAKRIKTGTTEDGGGA